MNLYLLTRTDEVGYDEYDACVVAACSIEDAVKIHPAAITNYESGWTTPENLKVEYIGTTTNQDPNSVILASFRAG